MIRLFGSSQIPLRPFLHKLAWTDLPDMCRRLDLELGGFRHPDRQQRPPRLIVRFTRPAGPWALPAAAFLLGCLLLGAHCPKKRASLAVSKARSLSWSHWSHSPGVLPCRHGCFEAHSVEQNTQFVGFPHSRHALSGMSSRVGSFMVSVGREWNQISITSRISITVWVSPVMRDNRAR